MVVLTAAIIAIVLVAAELIDQVSVVLTWIVSPVVGFIGAGTVLGVIDGALALVFAALALVGGAFGRILVGALNVGVLLVFVVVALVAVGLALRLLILRALVVARIGIALGEGGGPETGGDDGRHADYGNKFHLICLLGSIGRRRAPAPGEERRGDHTVAFDQISSKGSTPNSLSSGSA